MILDSRGKDSIYFREPLEELSEVIPAERVQKETFYKFRSFPPRSCYVMNNSSGSHTNHRAGRQDRHSLLAPCPEHASTGEVPQKTSPLTHPQPHSSPPPPAPIPNTPKF